MDTAVPTMWDEQAIARRLERIQDQPQLFSYYVTALKQWFILSTEDRAAQARTRFLRSSIEELAYCARQVLDRDIILLNLSEPGTIVGFNPFRKTADSDICRWRSAAGMWAGGHFTLCRPGQGSTDSNPATVPSCSGLALTILRRGSQGLRTFAFLLTVQESVIVHRRPNDG